MRRLQFWTNLLLFVLPLFSLLTGAFLYLRHVGDFLMVGKRVAYVLSVVATERVGQVVSIGDVEIRGSLWNKEAENQIVLTNVRIGEKANPSAPLAIANRVILGYRYNQLFEDPKTLQPILNEIVVVSPEVQLTRSARGKWNIAPMLQQLLGGKGEGKRMLVGRVVVKEATVLYKDASLPSPKGVPTTPFNTAFRSLSGVVLLRTDASAAFDFSSKAWDGVAQAFHITGILLPNPFTLQSSVELRGVDLTRVGKRVLPSQIAVISQGKADISLSANYVGMNHLKKFNPNGLFGSAKVTLTGVSLSGNEIQSPVTNASGTLLLTPTALRGSVAGFYSGTPVRAQGSIDNLSLFAPPKSAVRYEIQGVFPKLNTHTVVQYPVLSRWLQRSHAEVWSEISQLEGEGELQVVSAGTFQRGTVSTHWQLPILTNQTTTLQNVRAWLVYGDGVLHSQVSAQIGKGRLVVKTQSAKELSRIAIQGRDLKLEDFAPYWSKAKSAPQVSGLVQVSAALQKSPETEWKNSFALQAAQVRVNGQSFHTVQMKLDTLGERVFVRNLLIDDARGFLTAQGEVNRSTHQLDIRFAGDEFDIGSIRSAFDNFNAKSVTKPAVSIESSPVDIPLEGIAFIRGETDLGAHLSGTWDSPTVAGRITAFNVHLGKLEAERVEGVLNASRDRVVVRQGKLLLTPGFVTFSALVDGLRSMENTPPTVVVTAQAEKMDLNRILTMSGLPNRYSVSGTLSTDEISLTGTTKDLQTRTPVHIVLNDTTIENTPIANADLSVSYRDKTAIIEQATAGIAQGVVTAQGTVGSDGVLKIAIGAEEVDIVSLLAPYQPSEDLTTLQGRLFARASVGGTLENITANLRLQATNLQYQTYPFGQLSASGTYRNRVVTIQDAAVGELGEMEGRVYLSAVKYDLDNRVLVGSGGWAGVSITGVRDLLNRIGGESRRSASAKPNESRNTLSGISTALSPLEGVTSGTVQISGTTEEPVVSLNWDDTPLTIDRYPITLNKGSGTFTKTYASLPLINLAAQDGAVEISAKKIEYQGDMEASLATYNLNLAVISRWLNVSIAKSDRVEQASEFEKWLALPGKADIKGTGNISLLVKGKTTSPNVEQGSINLSKIDIGKVLPDGTRNSFVAFDKVDLNDITLKDGVVRSDGIAVRYQDTVVRGTVSIEGFQWASPLIIPTAKIHTTAKLVPRSDDEQNLQSLTRFLPNLLHKDSIGRLELSLETDGTQENPLQDVRGKIRLAAQRLQMARIATGLAQVNAQFELADGDLIVNSFKGKTQIYRSTEFAKKSGGAEVSLTGRLPLGLRDIVSPAASGGLRLQAEKLFFEEAPFPGAATGAARGQALLDMRLQGSLKAPTLTGKMVFSSTQFALPGEFLASANTTERLPAYPQFDLSFVAGSDVRLINQMMDTKVVGVLTAKGSPAEPRLDGRLDLLSGGHLRLVTTRMNLLNPSFITLKYPVMVNGEGIFALDVSLRAEANLIRNNNFGTGSERERTLVRIDGPLTGLVVDPLTGESKLRVSSTDPRVNSQTFMQSLLIGDPTQLERLGSLPGQALTQQLANAFTGAVLPDVFDKPAEQLGLRDLSLSFDPIRNVTLNVSRNLFGPVYVSYSRSLSSNQELFTFRTSLRIKDRYQVTYEIREQNEQRLLAEGIWRW